MGRRTGAKNVRTLEFVQLYDKLCEQYGDPVEVLFKIANGRYKPQIKVAACQNLLPYRYPKIQAENNSTDEQGDLFLVWANDEVEQQANDIADAS